MVPAGWDGVRRILVMRLDNIGDIVMISPALRTLRAHLPDAHITLMASPAGSQVAPMLPWVDEVLVRRVVWQDASAAFPLDPGREQELVADLRSGQYDAAVIFTSFSQSPYPPAYASYLAGIPIRLGQSKEFGGSLLSQWVRAVPDAVHQAERNLHLLEAAGFQIEARHLELRIPEEDARSAEDKLAARGIGPGAPFIALAPGASCPARRYDPARFAVVAQLLHKESGLPIVVLGSARESALLAPVVAAGEAGGILSLIGETSVPELAAIVEESELLLANDSGPMHMADALNRPMVILYSGTELESQWAPRRAPTRLLRRPTPCSPCHDFQCRYHMECLDFEPPEVVVAAIALLSQYGARHRASAPVAPGARSDDHYFR